MADLDTENRFLVVVEAAQLPTLTPVEIEIARAYVDASRSPATRLVYGRDWTAFSAWCLEYGHRTMPAHPSVVAVYISALAAGGMAPPTLNRKVAAIGYAHRQAGEEIPHKVKGGSVILDVLAGARRTWGKPPVKKTAADGDVLWALLHEIKGDGLRDVRDRAILAFGMSSAMRRSELAALDVRDVARSPEGLRITIRKSKSDQQGAGAVIAIPNGRRIKPVVALEAWLARSGVTEGPLFRRLSQDGRRVLDQPMGDRTVARVVQARAAAAGLDPAMFGGHSLRAGFLTSAARAGASVFKMQEVSRHKSVDVLAGYVRSAELFEDHAGSGFL